MRSFRVGVVALILLLCTLTLAAQQSIFGGTSGGGGTWGSITGTLSDQTDLQTALDAAAGSDTQILFNDNGSVAGSSDLTWDGPNSAFTIGDVNIVDSAVQVGLGGNGGSYVDVWGPNAETYFTVDVAFNSVEINGLGTNGVGGAAELYLNLDLDGGALLELKGSQFSRLRLGESGVRLDGANGALVMRGLSGTTEEVSFDFSAANVMSVGTSTGVTKLDFGTLILEGKFNSSDGTAGVTVTTCTSFKDGLCVAGT